MTAAGKSEIDKILDIHQSSASQDYINHKKQFQLHDLITEQRHPKTWNLSFELKDDIKRGLADILEVDEDVSTRLKKLADDPNLLEQAATAVARAVQCNRKIYIYGCGSTGRLAKQMESSLWRPFWRKARLTKLWDRIETRLPGNISELLIGEMTGGDRALISSLEGFEDLTLIGELQLLDRGIVRGDVVFAVTEGGETSSVIGTIWAAWNQYRTSTTDHDSKASQNLYFIYNNPDAVLMPFERSRKILENPEITKINLTTGPQAIAGSTRMQAATSETFVLGLILEQGILKALNQFLSVEELRLLGFDPNRGFRERLLDFVTLLDRMKAAVSDLSEFTKLEAGTYRNHGQTTYFAGKAMISVFIDCTERSPTFHLHPLDTINVFPPKSWLQVWTEGDGYSNAWRRFLHRPFRGLNASIYQKPFETKIDDQYLRSSALKSLAQAGSEQESLYDFSFSNQNLKIRIPKPGDLGVAVGIDQEINLLNRENSSFFQFCRLFKQEKSPLSLILAGDKATSRAQILKSGIGLDSNDSFLFIDPGGMPDPLGLNRQIMLKMMLNAHSTAVMALLGRVVGNTMTHVSPSNLKLIGRATHLILSHVNDTLSSQRWKKTEKQVGSISYAPANTVLFEAMEILKDGKGPAGEVETSIIFILEGIRRGRSRTWEEILEIVESIGLEQYLERHNSNLKRKNPSNK